MLCVSKKIKITELPLKKWTRDYKNFLEKLQDGRNSGNFCVDDIKEYHANNKVDFEITFKSDWG